MTRTLKFATLLALALFVTAAAVAQTATEIVTKSGTVLAKYDGKVVTQMEDGTVRQFTPAPGKTIMVDGVLTTYETLKVGTVLAGDFVKTTTTVPVETTTIKNGTVLKVTGNTVIVRHSDGAVKSHEFPSGFKFLVDGKETEVHQLKPNMKLTATIVSKTTKTVTEAEIKNLGGVAPKAPAPPPVAAAPAVAPAPAPAPAPEPPPAPAPAKKLPKTGSPLPLAALGGALSLLAGLGVRSFRLSR